MSKLVFFLSVSPVSGSDFFYMFQLVISIYVVGSDDFS